MPQWRWENLWHVAWHVRDPLMPHSHHPSPDPFRSCFVSRKKLIKMSWNMVLNVNAVKILENNSVWLSFTRQEHKTVKPRNKEKYDWKHTFLTITLQNSFNYNTLKCLKSLWKKCFVWRESQIKKVCGIVAWWHATCHTLPVACHHATHAPTGFCKGCGMAACHTTILISFFHSSVRPFLSARDPLQPHHFFELWDII